MSCWAFQEGKFAIPTPKQSGVAEKNVVGTMRPEGLGTHHPKADLRFEYATKGSPDQTGRPWTREEMQAGVDEAHMPPPCYRKLWNS